jgi:polar amino acid transport system permease protein
MDNFLQTFLNWELISGVLPDLLTTGIKNTLLLALGASVLGFVVALPLALMGLSHRWYLVLPARVFTDVFRGLPAILTILLFGQALSTVGLRLFGPTPFPLAIVALGLITAAYTGEILRAGIQSVEKGQLEAARALGLSYGSAMRLAVIPQGIRRVIPTLVNQFIAVIKDSSLVYTLGLIADEREIFRIGQDASVSNANLSPLVAAGLVYLLLTVPLTHIVNAIDRRLREGRTPFEEPPTALPGGPNAAPPAATDDLLTLGRH